MKKCLVGYTGFVGGNIAANGTFDGLYNSKNIEKAYGTQPDLLIYAGLRAEKFLANKDPEKDMELIIQAEENIKKIKPKQIVLISTIDVFKNTTGVNEETEIDCNGLHAYGLHRYRLECWVREHYPDTLVIRLPGLFGIGLKKNFIYDFMHIIPSMLSKEKFAELAVKDVGLKQYYLPKGNGFYKCRDLSKYEKQCLKEKFRHLGFTALNFTDSRNVYQFYPLERLGRDIHTALEHNLKIWHPATEPILAGELFQYLTGGEKFENQLGGTPVQYDCRTLFDGVFGGAHGYILDKNAVLKHIKKFTDIGEEI